MTRTLTVNCDDCLLQRIGCSDCAVSARMDRSGSHLTLSGAQQAALGVLAQHGLLPPLRMVTEKAA